MISYIASARKHLQLLRGNATKSLRGFSSLFFSASRQFATKLTLRIMIYEVASPYSTIINVNYGIVAVHLQMFGASVIGSKTFLSWTKVCDDIFLHDRRIWAEENRDKENREWKHRAGPNESALIIVKYALFRIVIVPGFSRRKSDSTHSAMFVRIMQLEYFTIIY